MKADNGTERWAIDEHDLRQALGLEPLPTPAREPNASGPPTDGGETTVAGEPNGTPTAQQSIATTPSQPVDPSAYRPATELLRERPEWTRTYYANWRTAKRHLIDKIVIPFDADRQTDKVRSWYHGKFYKLHVGDWKEYWRRRDNTDESDQATLE